MKSLNMAAFKDEANGHVFVHLWALILTLEGTNTESNMSDFDPSDDDVFVTVDAEGYLYESEYTEEEEILQNEI